MEFSLHLGPSRKLPVQAELRVTRFMDLLAKVDSATTSGSAHKSFAKDLHECKVGSELQKEKEVECAHLQPVRSRRCRNEIEACV